MDDGGEACQVAGSYPLYCTEAEAIAASPEASAHEMSGAWMPNAASPMIMDGTYDGDASECPCGDADGDHGDHGDHGDGDGDEEHHDDHDGHDHGDGDGEFAYEWGGIFVTDLASYTWTAQKVGGAYADLESSFEIGSEWRTRKSFVPTFYSAGFWPWTPQCDGTSSNVTVAEDAAVYVANFPAFNARDAAATVTVTALGHTRVIAAYESDCDFDDAGAGAAAADVTCTVGALSGVDVEVAYAPVAGEDLGAWRLTSIKATYGGSGGVNDVFTGTETASIAKFPAAATRSVKVTLRDAGAPGVSSFPPLRTASKIYGSIGFFVAALFTLPIHPYLMGSYVMYNVAVNEGKPPPGWQIGRASCRERV